MKKLIFTFLLTLATPMAAQFSLALHMEIDEQEMDRELIFDDAVKTWCYEFNNIKSEITAAEQGESVMVTVNLWQLDAQNQFVELSKSAIVVEWGKPAALCIRHLRDAQSARTISFGFVASK